MVNSQSGHGFYAGRSESEDDNDLDEKDGGHDSDSSASFIESQMHNTPTSYTNKWPQSYRESMDVYSSVQSANMAFIGTPPLTRFSSSFLLSSFMRKRTSGVFSSVTKLLLSHDDQNERLHSSALLPPGEKHTTSQDTTEPRRSTFGQAVLNGINILCGVGVLSTPYAVKEGGWLGLLVLFTFAFLSCYTGLLLRRCLDSHPGLETYPDIGQAAFGTLGRIVISIVLYAELYACCVEYIILESDNLSSLFPNAHINLGGFQLGSHQSFALLATMLVLPTTCLKDLSILSYISAGGVVASVLVVACLFWVGMVDEVGFHVSDSHELNLSTLPVAIGLYGYCYSGHAVLPNIYSSMKKSHQYTYVLLTSFAICTLLYVGVAVMGYLMFGESTLSQFTLNLPKDLLASKVAVWTTIINPFTKYALTMMPVALSLEELIPISSSMKSHYFITIAIRTTLVMSTLIVSLAIPFFGLVMALIGSLLTMLVSFILPCVCYLRILRGRICTFQVSLCVLVIAVGVLSSMAGSYSTLIKIIHNLN